MASPQILKMYFQTFIPAGFSWELGDASGTVGTGVLTSDANQLSCIVPSGNSLKHEYILRFMDVDGVPYPHAKLDYADGGIVIVENLDIHENDPSRTTTKMTAARDNLKMES